MSIRYKGQSISGPPGKDAIINGLNTLEIVAGNNVTIEQQDGRMTISSAAATMEEVNTAIDTAITGAIKKVYYGA